MRGELHVKELITDDEFTELAKDHPAVERLEEDDCHRQRSGGICRKCGGFTTYKRQNTHGLCMRCEVEVNK